ncbi:MAG: hypothetical protein HQ523_13425 [Lentisphaerae bacterium]|nr:hypothetical protein [Lentisphaerota bacterium]
MKNISIISLLLIFCAASVGAAPKSSSRVGGGVRYHTAQDTVVAAPFDNDVSYGLLYEYHEGETFWQLGVNYATSMGSNDVDSVITPEVNLVFADKLWRGGVGVLSSYIKDEVGSDWTDLYYQLILGLEIPVGKMSLEVLAYYVFDDFNSIKEFNFNEIEVGAWLMYAF